MGTKQKVNVMAVADQVKELSGQGLDASGISRELAKRGYISNRGKAFSVTSIGRALEATGSEITAKPKARKPRKPAGRDKAINSLMRHVIVLKGVDAETKVALMDLISSL